MEFLFLLAAASVLVSSTNGQSRVCVCVATPDGGNVNVRSCASTSCSSLGLMTPGECHDFLTWGDPVWQEISYKGQTGYVHSNYTSGPQRCGGGSHMVANLCSSFSSNQKRLCDDYGCGNYKATRSGGAHLASDVQCQPAGAIVYAPFDGTIQRRAHPIGDGSCCDVGFVITGTGEFAGHSVTIYYSDPDRVTVPSSVTKGQAVATHRSLLCGGCYDSRMTDHIHYQMEYNGVNIDPASWLFVSP